MTNRWDSELWVPRPAETLFQYLSDAANLDHLTPPWLRVRILTGGPIRMASGTRIDYRLRLYGIPFRWQSEITHWEPPSQFMERQARGPYRSWALRHEFVPRDGGTLIRDQMEYEVPGGPVVDRLIVRPSMERIYAFRARRLQDLFPATGDDAR